eukprot:357881-Chlamydomonas_euryale.AAC.24
MRRMGTSTTPGGHGGSGSAQSPAAAAAASATALDPQQLQRTEERLALHELIRLGVARQEELKVLQMARPAMQDASDMQRTPDTLASPPCGPALPCRSILACRPILACQPTLPCSPTPACTPIPPYRAFPLKRPANRCRALNLFRPFTYACMCACLCMYLRMWAIQACMHAHVKCTACTRAGGCDVRACKKLCVHVSSYSCVICSPAFHQLSPTPPSACLPAALHLRPSYATGAPLQIAFPDDVSSALLGRSKLRECGLREEWRCARELALLSKLAAGRLDSVAAARGGGVQEAQEQHLQDQLVALRQVCGGEAV